MSAADHWIQPCNWLEFQNYKDRCPPWIKLHRLLLDKKEWRRASDYAGKLLVDIWLLASECDHVDWPEERRGRIEMRLDDIAYRLRRDSDMQALCSGLAELSALEFVSLSSQLASDLQAAGLQDDSTAQAERLHVSYLNTEERRGEATEEREREPATDPPATSRVTLPVDLEQIAESYQALLPRWPQPRFNPDNRKTRCEAIRREWKRWQKDELHGRSDPTAFALHVIEWTNAQRFARQDMTGVGFDWLFQRKNLQKILEENYHGDRRSGNGSDPAGARAHRKAVPGSGQEDRPGHEGPAAKWLRRAAQRRAEDRPAGG